MPPLLWQRLRLALLLLLISLLHRLLLRRRWRRVLMLMSIGHKHVTPKRLLLVLRHALAYVLRVCAASEVLVALKM